MMLVAGRIVNLSSALSRFSLPNRSTYGITKYGIQALSDCLRFEMKRWGISVSIIEPGSLVSGKRSYTNVLEYIIII
jgi:3-hydroxybutyrate dehydrogenase